MALTQDQIAAQMVAQLRVLDPSVSAEVGTPERKILDTLAQALAEGQLDLTLLSGALDLDAKVGSDLDAFVGLFGFGRQQGSFATGFVTFSRATPSPYNIIIPRATQVQGSSSSSINGIPGTFPVTFMTSTAVTLVAGQTSVTAPIQAIVTGAQGNVAANTITQFANIGAPVLGITTVDNPLPTGNGAEPESDAELKVRFRNTVFRNVAGTEDQYLALAIATQFSTKANVIGPISRWREYVQIPEVDDGRIDADGPGQGLFGFYTSIPSQNPYVAHVYTEVPYFVSNGESGAAMVFYRSGTDFFLNVPPLDFGDTFRESRELDIPKPRFTPNNPNVTFRNIYTGTDPSVTMPRPGGVVLLEYSYLSTESRNDLDRGVTNCVDVFVNGENPTLADAAIPPPIPLFNLFTANPADIYYYEHFRRIGVPDARPGLGNIFTALYWQPVIDLPIQIVAGDNKYLKGVHYWPVEDISLIGNTVRARNGIEWAPSLNGLGPGDTTVTPWTSGQDWQIGDQVWYGATLYTALHNLTADATSPDLDFNNWTFTLTNFTGTPVTHPGVTTVPVTGYTYDKNIVDLQAAVDKSKQVTTDVLAHRATRRYFKLYLTVVYAPGASVSATNGAIASAVGSYLDGQYFGSTIQLADLLFVVRSVSGVANVRWTDDVINAADLLVDTGHPVVRIVECDANGNPRSGSHTFDIDFTLRDSELPALPNLALADDTLPGLVIETRARATFNIV